ncbi:ATP-binding cassette domain-containing protein [Leptospira sp. 96542]|nr:ATP-binding cassette domain-containing protein [Leptospira sp. 96542]
MDEVLLESQSLSITVGEKTILKEVSIRFFRTGLCIFEGDNGAGKSTLLKEIYHKAKYSQLWHWPLGVKTITYLGHELGLYTSLSLEENLEYFLGLEGGVQLVQKQIPKQKFLLESFHLDKRRFDPVYMFSRGMKQKVALMRCLLSKSEILLFDEPFTGLDQKSVDALVRQLNEESKTRLVIIVLHGIPKTLEWTSKIMIQNGSCYVESFT